MVQPRRRSCRSNGVWRGSGVTVNTPDPSGLRREYAPEAPLTESDLAPTWRAQFDRWLADAVAAALVEPNAMVLATADAQGRPSTRTVLLKEYDDAGFVFFTNYRSRKAAELAVNPYVSLLFRWLPLHRQVVVTGCARPLPPARNAAYFATRPRGSQLGAWASPQSSALPDRAALEEAYRAAAARYAGAEVPCPPHWGGYVVEPDAVEFWQGQPDRLHDRLRFTRTAPGAGAFAVARLAP
ncbi:MAG TPA: pyridoxamine 5'-phosphate oxidase [Pilimelia sp.]|nr:pyridoxamine 5'-phosphate oxidase [Pilimelia sp.]